jgi:hypothetical protein
MIQALLSVLPRPVLLHQQAKEGIDAGLISTARSFQPGKDIRIKVRVNNHEY